MLQLLRIVLSVTTEERAGKNGLRCFVAMQL
jgi:hypothetical protein